MSSKTAQTAAQSAKRLQNEFGADLWVKDQQKTYRHRTGGRGMFAGLQDSKHYDVDSGWAKRAEETQPGFFGWLYNRVLTTEPQGSSWRQMRAWAMTVMATAAAERTESKTTLPTQGATVLEPIRAPISMQSPSPMAALAMQMRQNAQRRTMATMASPSPSPFPFLGPLFQNIRRSHRSYPHPRRLPARTIIPPSPESRFKLRFPLPNMMTKALPLTIVSLAFAAATASWVVTIVLQPINRLQFSSSTSASLASGERRSITAIPPPHQVYDQAMYNDPAFGNLMVEKSDRSGHPLLGPVACFFLPDASEERIILRDRYDYSFWVDGMDS